MLRVISLTLVQHHVSENQSIFYLLFSFVLGWFENFDFDSLDRSAIES